MRKIDLIYRTRQLAKYCCLLVFVFISAISYAQREKPAKKEKEEKQKIEVPSMIKEELHRYMGYEALLPKYISLPYDVTMDTNLRGEFIDISFLFLLFIPILLFIGLKEPWLKIVLGVLLLLFLIISFSTGYSARKQVPLAEVADSLDQELLKTHFSNSPLTYIKLKTNQVSDLLYKGFDKRIVQVFSGEGDTITYPFILALFIVFFFVLEKRFRQSPIGERALFYFTYLYFFLWLVLGAGVPWYGILLLGLAPVLIIVGLFKNSQLSTHFYWLKYPLFAGIVIWVSTAFAYRLANYHPFSEQLSRTAIHEASLYYGLGKKNKAEIMNYLYPNYWRVITEINSNPDAYVYRIGTFFHYFIEGNDRRVLQDNQLGIFESLCQYTENKEAIVRGLKKTGYRYILVDLNVATVDLTPERSLEQKTKLLGEFLVDNPGIQLFATDRVVQDENGQLKYSLSTRNIKNPGTFAAFKIK